MKSKVYSILVCLAGLVATAIIIFRDSFAEGDAISLAGGIIATVIGLVFTIDSISAIVRVFRSPTERVHWFKIFGSVLLSLICLLWGMNLLSQVVGLLK